MPKHIKALQRVPTQMELLQLKLASLQESRVELQYEAMTARADLLRCEHLIEELERFIASELDPKAVLTPENWMEYIGRKEGAK
jgi:hypothetical protein